ncbi:MAG: protoheme IX farnesyltransferase [Rickettsiaceae bacterium]|nr:protoheme IX farnesyltransferase [Rickettsiaceae bacterium]
MNKVSISQSSIINSSFRDYISLMKPRVMSLVVFTALCGMFLAPGYIHPLISFEAILFIALGAGSAAAINMWYDIDIDTIMRRTQKRPTVKKLIPSEEALAFGVITGILSVVMMAVCINILSAILLAITILYYIFIYTIWLKRSSIYNVVIGGVSGALPPVIGWTSVTAQISIEPIILFLIIFMWTPPHSWALALFRSQDYRIVGIPMMPVIKGEPYTKRQILYYSLLMVIVTYLPYFALKTNSFYLLIISVLNSIFLYICLKLFDDPHYIYAKKLFWYSIFYLFMIFISLIICHQI